uniref:DUF2693 domain-containing protein n=1 Tax=Panagrellus redivivus TaxID=6233 RepID=A0A7E4V1G3_PANRE
MTTAFLRSNPENVIYEDDYVRLSEDLLVIKRYFFPLMRPKYIRTAALSVAYYDDIDSAKYANLRTWGKSTETGVYWAFDYQRCLSSTTTKPDAHKRAYVVVDIEDGVRKGFTCCDIKHFIECLTSVAPMSLIVIDNLRISKP